VTLPFPLPGLEAHLCRPFRKTQPFFNSGNFLNRGSGRICLPKVRIGSKGLPLVHMDIFQRQEFYRLGYPVIL
jgi:hypothetical protein